MKKIILIGSFAGNNAGDMVVLESIVNDFNNFTINNKNVSVKSIFADIDLGEKIELIIPTLNVNGIKYINKVLSVSDNIEISAIPIEKNIKVIIRSVKKLIREFSKADFIYTTAGVLFDQRIWNPLYNFVVVYTPLMIWAKFNNPKVKIIGYNVGITSKSKIVGKYILKKCVRLHDKIYLREKKDVTILKKFAYKGKVYYSADNVFGYHKPQSRKKDAYKRIFINLTLYGISDEANFIKEMAEFILKIKSEYEVYFFQTSDRDLQVAIEVCNKTGLSNDRIHCLWSNRGGGGYKEIQDLLSKCDIVIGMRMHSIIFALKNGCSVIAIDYAPKVETLMCDIKLDDFLIPINKVSSDELLTKLDIIGQQDADLIYKEVNRRYLLCESYKT